MNTPEDQKWQSLLNQSRPTFAAADAPPYGFVTRALARLRSEESLQRECERIGWRAFLASLAALAVAIAVTFTVNFQNAGGDFEPGIGGVIQMEKIQVS